MAASNNQLRPRGRVVLEANRLPQAAREGLMRAWLEVLRQRHPHVSWIPAAAPTIITDESDPENELAPTPALATA